MEKKYKLTEETLAVDGHVLHRIIALRDFGGVKKGDLGGFIEKESNLAHDWNCWIYNDAVVLGNAEVYDNAKVEKNTTTSCSRIGGAVEDILLGRARTICGLLGAFTVRVRNLSRRLMLTARRKVVSMREL